MRLVELLAAITGSSLGDRVMVCVGDGASYEATDARLGDRALWLTAKIPPDPGEVRHIVWSDLPQGPRVSLVRVPEWDPVAAEACQRVQVPGDYRIRVLGTVNGEGLRNLGEELASLLEMAGLDAVDMAARDAAELRRPFTYAGLEDQVFVYLEGRVRRVMEFGLLPDDRVHARVALRTALNSVSQGNRRGAVSTMLAFLTQFEKA